MKQYLFFTLAVAMLLGLAGQPAVAAPTQLSLDECIAMALENNPAMQIAQGQREESVWSLAGSNSDTGFSVGYTYTGQRTTAPPSFMSPFVTYSPYNIYASQLAITLPLYSGGKLESAIDAAKLALNVSDLNITSVKQQLKLDTTTAYFNVLQAGNMLEVAKQSVTDFAGHLKNVQSQYSAGAVPFSDVLQTKVSLANAQDGLIKAQNTSDLSVYKLNNIIGLPLRNDTQPKESLKYEKYLPTMDDSLAYALAHRPEITQMQDNLAIAAAQVRIARSSALPTVELSGTKGWEDLNLPGYKYGDWTVSLIANFDVFDSGRTKAAMKKAEYEIQVLQGQVRQVRDNISLEVSQAYQNLKEAEKRIETSNVAVEQARLDFKLAQERYDNGISINLDVVDAELALTQAKTNYIQALYDYNTSRAQLDKAMGVPVREPGSTSICQKNSWSNLFRQLPNRRILQA